MSQEPANDDVKLREELVAYLDGELSADESRQIERRLAEEPDTRRAMQELDRTWNLLDELDAPAVDDGFTRTTMEMVALAAGKDAEQAKAEAPRRRRRRTLWTAAALAAAALAWRTSTSIIRSTGSSFSNCSFARSSLRRTSTRSRRPRPHGPTTRPPPGGSAFAT